MTDTSTNRPSHRLYSVTGNGQTAHWNDMGAAWMTKSGKGFTIKLEAIPLDGRIVMCMNDGKPKEAG